MNFLRQLFGIGLRGELEKTRIALGVAREIADDWKARAIESQTELMAFKTEHALLKEKHEQQQRVASITAKALSGLAPVAPTIIKK